MQGFRINLFAVKLIFFISLFACGKDLSSNSSEIKITNGQDIKEDVYPAVVFLKKLTSEASFLCTGTFVNDYQVITAGHCVEGSDVKIYYEKNPGSADDSIFVPARAYRKHQSYTTSVNHGINAFDIAIIDFPENTAPAVLPLARHRPRVGSRVGIVGYGNNRNEISLDGKMTGSGSGMKRYGTNHITSFRQEGMITISGLSGSRHGIEIGKHAVSGAGDSGGPMIFNGHIVGVLSGGSISRETEHSRSFYVDLKFEASRIFLIEHLDMDFPEDRYATLNIKHGDDDQGQVGEWLYGALKGTCPTGMRLLGMSQDQRALCTNTEQPSLQSKEEIKVVAVHEQYGELGLGDWAYGHTKYECPTNHFAVGFSKHWWGTSGLLCRSSAKELGKQCRALWFKNRDYRASRRGGDFAPYSYKGQCAKVEYIGGLAHRDGRLSAILCCR